jgi:ATP-binding cassette subfamily F protein 3
MLYRFDDIHKAFGVHEVLSGVTWQHNPGERVGLVGRNGAGKTTLFKLLLGEEEPDRGTVTRASRLRLGHLSQHLNAAPEASLFDFVLSAFEKVLAIEAEMRALEHRLADSAAEEHQHLLDAYAQLQHDYEHADGYKIHSEVERVLSGLGFAKEEWDRPIATFSGGQQNRAMLARLLLKPVDVLLLDEPTNHLDLQGIEFLEEFLQSFSGAYLLVSHDRTFLNRTVGKIVELSLGTLVEYPGNYDRFLILRSQRMEQMRTEFERRQQFVEKTEEFIRRNIAGQKTKQAQSRRKMLARLEEVERPQDDQTLARFSLDAGPRSGMIALTAEDLVAGYQSRAVVAGLNLTIRRGERIAIMGPNGSGKTTVLKTLAGLLPPLEGTLNYGYNVQTGYYDQTLGDLDYAGTVIDEVWNLDHSKTEEEVRNYLARFSFFGEDVFKRVRSLSGGEKGRLALAKIMYVGGNLLLLDEPTNHLDVYTREALEEALEQFTGALVVVSHDRYFIDRIAQQILIVEDGEAVLHSGTYSDLVERFRREAQQVSTRRPSPAPAIQLRGESRSADRKKRKVAEEINSIERRIAEIERTREANDLLLCSEEVYRDGTRVRDLQAHNLTLASELSDLYRRWEALLAETTSAGS